MAVEATPLEGRSRPLPCPWPRLRRWTPPQAWGRGAGSRWGSAPSLPLPQPLPLALRDRRAAARPGTWQHWRRRWVRPWVRGVWYRQLLEPDVGVG